MSEALQKYTARTDDTDVFRVAEAMAKSGYFKDARDAAQAVVKILAGRELGFGAFTSMSNIVIVEGKLTLSANMIAALVKGSKRYDYQVLEHTETVCTLEFYQEGIGAVGQSSFTMEDAKRAGLAGKFNWKSYPKNMLFARAMSNGAKWYCADVFMTGIYTPEELGADDLVDAEVVPNGTERDYHGGFTAPPEKTAVERANDFKESIENDPLDLGKITEKQRKRLFAVANEYHWSEEAMRFLIASSDYGSYQSTKDITVDHYDKIIDALKSQEVQDLVIDCLAVAPDQEWAEVQS